MSWWSRKKPSTDPQRMELVGGREPGADSVARFWAWWQAEGAQRADAAITSGRAPDLADLLARRVDEVDAGLSWELGPGPAGSRHVLTVTAAGDPALRARARRWLLGAPAPDSTWAYSDHRLPSRDLDYQLQVAGRELRPGDVVTAWRLDPVRDCLDVTVHHPAYSDLPERARQEATFLLLDQALGEVAVETWIGAIDSATRSPAPPELVHLEDDDLYADMATSSAGAGTLPALRQAVERLASAAVDAGGAPVWKLMHAAISTGTPVLIARQIPLRPASAPHLDQHVTITLPFSPAESSGLPGPASLRALQDFAREVDTALDGRGRVLAHETSAGQRTLHAYYDSTTPPADGLYELLADWTEGRPTLRTSYDPAWHEVDHLRG